MERNTAVKLKDRVGGGWKEFITLKKSLVLLWLNGFSGINLTGFKEINPGSCALPHGAA